MNPIKRIQPITTVWVALTILLALVAGCSLLGTSARDPGKFEESLFSTTNVPMLTVHAFTNTVTVTNIVPREVTNVVTVQKTNEVGVFVPIFETNHVTVYDTNRTQVEKVIPAGSTVMVPQLVAPSATGQAAIATGSGIAGLWGLGPLAGMLLSGGFNWWQKARNAALAAKYTGASQGALVANQTSAVLVQNVETLLEVLNGTPQGQAALPAVKSYLMNHQLEAGVIDQVAAFVNQHVDNEAARDAAAEVLKAVSTLKA